MEFIFHKTINFEDNVEYSFNIRNNNEKNPKYYRVVITMDECDNNKVLKTECWKLNEFFDKSRRLCPGFQYKHTCHHIKEALDLLIKHGVKYELPTEKTNK